MGGEMARGAIPAQMTEPARKKGGEKPASE